MCTVHDQSDPLIRHWAIPVGTSPEEEPQHGTGLIMLAFSPNKDNRLRCSLASHRFMIDLWHWGELVLSGTPALRQAQDTGSLSIWLALNRNSIWIAVDETQRLHEGQITASSGGCKVLCLSPFTREMSKCIACRSHSLVLQDGKPQGLFDALCSDRTLIMTNLKVGDILERILKSICIPRRLSTHVTPEFAGPRRYLPGVDGTSAVTSTKYRDAPDCLQIADLHDPPEPEYSSAQRELLYIEDVLKQIVDEVCFPIPGWLQKIMRDCSRETQKHFITGDNSSDTTFLHEFFEPVELSLSRYALDSQMANIEGLKTVIDYHAWAQWITVDSSRDCSEPHISSPKSQTENKRKLGDLQQTDPPGCSTSQKDKYNASGPRIPSTSVSNDTTHNLSGADLDAETESACLLSPDGDHNHEVEASPSKEKFDAALHNSKRLRLADSLRQKRDVASVKLRSPYRKPEITRRSTETSTGVKWQPMHLMLEGAKVQTNGENRTIGSLRRPFQKHVLQSRLPLRTNGALADMVNRQSYRSTVATLHQNDNSEHDFLQQKDSKDFIGEQTYHVKEEENSLNLSSARNSSKKQENVQRDVRHTSPSLDFRSPTKACKTKTLPARIKQSKRRVSKVCLPYGHSPNIAVRESTEDAFPSACKNTEGHNSGLSNTASDREEAEANVSTHEPTILIDNWGSGWQTANGQLLHIQRDPAMAAEWNASSQYPQRDCCETGKEVSSTVRPTCVVSGSVASSVSDRNNEAQERRTLIDLQLQLQSRIREVKEDIKAAESAVRVELRNEDLRLSSLARKWKSIAQEACNRLYVEFSYSVQAAGGIKQYSQSFQPRSQYMTDFKQRDSVDSSAIDQAEQCDNERAEGSEINEFRMDMLLAHYGISTDSIGWNSALGDWE